MHRNRRLIAILSDQARRRIESKMDLIFAGAILLMVAYLVLTKKMHLDLFKDRIYRIFQLRAPGSTIQDDLLDQIEDTYTMRKALAILCRLTFSMHNYLCARSLIYLFSHIVKTMLQPVKEPTQPIPNNEIGDFGPFVKRAAG